MTPQLSVIMLAYGEEEWLGAAVDAVLASTGVSLEIVLVDNGCTSDAVSRVAGREGVRVIRPSTNLGFAGGVNLGVRESRAPFIAMVNSDAEVEPDCLRLLVERAGDESVGIAGALVLLADQPNKVNSAGNPLHVLGLCWAGQMGEDAARVPEVADVASASGATMVLRRTVWDDLGGFPGQFFAYLEDLELSWRCWQRGLRVEVLADARVRHHYEFGRSPLKMYLVERNRWLFLLTCHELKTLALLALPLLAFDVALLAVAASQGWARQKVRSWGWVLRHPGWIRRRRRLVQGTRTVSDQHLTRLLTDRFDPAQMALPAAAQPLESLLRAYWRLVRPLV
ncbi:glycosyltransferase family 2 protein [Georgenia ruanii]|uniref:Glycosyltransferase n=1 Tax=Georgenia ruanii TaxID=348442 RepID=A0A7J9USU2_9MICO|nr:glycosyltransferase family 2 protein [Georgenia ruanii]MPV87669.1 glycosyltransferase [Georgenia ruanii]